MPSYFYRARDPEGRPHEGVQVATSEEEVVRTLERSKLIPIFVVTRAAESESRMARTAAAWGRYLEHRRTHVKPVQVALFARQLATMTAAGMPVVRSLQSIGRDLQDRRLTRILSQVADSVERGDSLSEALSKHPGAFDAVFVSLVHTGEVSGTLDRILDQTANYMERAESLRLRVRAALRYPMFVLCFMGFVLAAMLVKIVPMFSEIYERFRVPLPWPTRVLVDSSSAVINHLPFWIVGLGLAALGATYALSSEAGRLAVDRIKLRLPLFGPLIRMYAISRFSRALGILTASGTQILHALKVIRPVPGNRLIERAIDRVRAEVEGGVSLATALQAAEVFPEMLIQMTGTGEETGELDNMLARTADFYEQRVTAAVDGLSSLIEPIAIVILGGLVGVMLVALYLPIFSLGQAMKTGLGAP